MTYQLHWSATPLHEATGDVLEYRAAEYERYQAEREFLATGRGTLEAWSAANYMETAFQTEAALYCAARDRREPA